MRFVGYMDFKESRRDRMNEPVIPERMGQPLSYCELEDCTLIIQARLSAAEAKVAELEENKLDDIERTDMLQAKLKELDEDRNMVYRKLSLATFARDELQAKVAEQEATITKEESRSNELAKEVAILRVNLKGQEATIARLTGPLQLFLKYAPLSGDMALMIRASQPGGDEAHNRANKLIEHFEHLNEAHDKGQAALSKQEPAAAKEGE